MGASRAFVITLAARDTPLGSKLSPMRRAALVYALFTRFPGAFSTVFLLTAVARLVVALAARVLLLRVGPAFGPIPPARVVAWLPHGGMVRRLFPGEDDA